ncbi:hypothetical protein GUITHDRAFT_117544 [Guillardia theta CCMP2712]|uniref:RRM domain-containing protein n=1 Tax=Guillardia theta (strain CCMP2712) TaxID=905079 RepID=L1IK84_GUITC|nr:hypothetical protein GUITHDRAFT_117544 [Guillardia theta CCMP2712]EKX36314.1 hypothetical protein GUITHDRAFT_117544 [Guillardia theta CCMP2712]|eukprot:XP_005823294.1 hypothetical protein GUITHDRAFT_117544 [Guillardia theta CCMP2712]
MPIVSCISITSIIMSEEVAPQPKCPRTDLVRYCRKGGPEKNNCWSFEEFWNPRAVKIEKAAERIIDEWINSKNAPPSEVQPTTTSPALCAGMVEEDKNTDLAGKVDVVPRTSHSVEVAGNWDVPVQEQANGSQDDERTEQPISIEDEYYEYQDYDEEVPHECWELWDVFEQFGMIASIAVQNQQKEGLYNALAFVNFLDESSAKSAFEDMKGGQILGKPIKVRPPQPKVILCSARLLDAYESQFYEPEDFDEVYQEEHSCNQPDSSVELQSADPRGPHESWEHADVLSARTQDLQLNDEEGIHNDKPRTKSTWISKAMAAPTYSPSLTSVRSLFEETAVMTLGLQASSTLSRLGRPRPVGSYFCNDLVHPSVSFQRCQQAGAATRSLVGAVQSGKTLNGTDYVSFRGFPQWAAELAVDPCIAQDMLERSQHVRGSREAIIPLYTVTKERWAETTSDTSAVSLLTSCRPEKAHRLNPSSEFKFSVSLPRLAGQRPNEPNEPHDSPLPYFERAGTDGAANS